MCDVGLEREKNIGTNDRWCQTWSYILISKCEMHETLVVIHWLTINACKGDFQARWQIPEEVKFLRVPWEEETDGGASNCSHLYLYDIYGTQERSSQPSLTNLTLTLHATAPQPLQNLQNLHLKTLVRGAM